MTKFYANKAAIVELLAALTESAKAADTDQALELIDIPVLNSTVRDGLDLRGRLLATAIGNAICNYIHSR